MTTTDFHAVPISERLFYSTKPEVHIIYRDRDYGCLTYAHCREICWGLY